MGLLDHATPGQTRVMVAMVILAMAGLFIAMIATTPVVVLSDEKAKELNGGDQAWMLISTALVLLMTPGVAFFYGGMVQHKNIVATIMQCYVCLAIIPILWSAVGFSISFAPSVRGSAGIFGSPFHYALLRNVGGVPNAFLGAGTIPLALYWLFQLMFAIITPTLIIGAVADRVNISALIIFVSIWHVALYCPLAHMVWHPTGLIRKFGVLDFAGGTVVHMSSGYAALVAAMYLGKGHAAAPGFEHLMEPANVPYVVLGSSLLWFGWFGFNAGSAVSSGPLASLAFLNTNAAAASAMITWMLMDIVRGKKMRATGACVGAVIGLVAITPASGFVTNTAAYLIGVIGAVVCSLVSELMEHFGKRYIDDTLDVFAAHGVGGTVGMICTGLFCTTKVNSGGADGAFYGNPVMLGKTLLVLVCLVPWICVLTLICLWVSDMIMSLRATDEEILVGLDVSKHGERAFFTIDAVTGVDSSVHGGATLPLPAHLTPNGGSVRGAMPVDGMAAPANGSATVPNGAAAPHMGYYVPQTALQGAAQV